MAALTGTNDADDLIMTLDQRGQVFEIDLLGGSDDIDFYDQYRLGVEENVSGLRGIVLNVPAGTVTDTAGVTSTIRNVEGFFGTEDDDSFTGGDVAEIFRPFGGEDIIIGGAGSDLLSYSLDFNNGLYSSGIDMVFGAPGSWGTVVDPSGNVDRFLDVERVRTTLFSDKITGNDERNVFQLFGGGDVIDGRGGKDLVSYNTFEFTTVYAASLKQGITIDLTVVDANGYVRVATPLGGGDTDRLANIEDVIGSLLDDRISGDNNANYLGGSAGNDTIFGRGGNDLLEGGAGEDTLDGGLGLDIAVYEGTRAAHQVTATQASGGGYNIVVSGADNGTDRLFAVERLQFNDGILAFDIEANAGQAYRIYQAAFARTPDNDGLKYWIEALDTGITLLDVARGFVASAEFQSVYGANPSNLSLVEKLYENVLGRSGEAAGIAYWESELNSGNRDQARVLMDFAESAENILGVAPAISEGIFFS